MSSPELPTVVGPSALEPQLGAEDLLLVDLCRPETYSVAHLPGAVHLPYAAIVASSPPVGGLLPDPQTLGRTLAEIGLTPGSRVVAYDDEGGAKAARLLWTLDVIGHPHRSLLDGGLHAWAHEGLPLESVPVMPTPSATRALTLGDDWRADKDYILANLGNTEVVLLDTRSAAEYHGLDRRAARGGHIPGAVNIDWVLAIDRARSLRLKPEPELRGLLEERGVTPEREVVAYCQTHHRSSHTYLVLRALGYARVRGYPGAWSEWGNLPDTPVEA